MASSISCFLMSKRVKYEELSSSIMFVFVFLTTLVLSQTSDNCILDIDLSSSSANSNCAPGNWGGFINNNCCGIAFDKYLYALALRANQTRNIYISSSEQTDCFVSMKRIDKDIFSCGIEKLTNGAGGCSDYTTMDVNNKLGNSSRNLDEDCKLLSSDGNSAQACNACLRSWDEIRGASDNEIESTVDKADVCRFAVLVTITSNRIDDKNGSQAVFQCLREHKTFSVADEQGSTASGDKHISTGLYFLIGSLVGIGAIVSIAALILFRRRNKTILPAEKDDDSFSRESSYLKIPIKEIHLATNNLNASNYIGQGIAGKVYKGILSNGQHVAVKHIINDGQIETFVREVRSLSHIRHPNLVALLGFCEREDECFLVYELCHNGNLSEWLFGKGRDLSWIQRLGIAIDGAKGLWFLHTYPEGHIVHRDIKPTNILIDANFQAKLSDFGLSKVMDVGQSYVSSEVRGTFGYVDPEYRSNHRVNAAGDVYSFGIVLLQLLSAQRVINLNSNRPMPLSKMARFLTRGGNISEFADPKLNGEYSVEAFNLVFQLALSCTGPKQQRPSMEQVVQKLEKALEIST